jgi:hypothetical protein
MLATLILIGCGDGGDGRQGIIERNVGAGAQIILPSPIPARNVKIELKNEINRDFDSLGNLNYLGELINTGGDPACFVKIVIDSMNASGELIGSDSIYVYGSTLSVGSAEADSCLNPGEAGGFQISTSQKSIPASASITINWDADNISPPAVPPSQVVLDGSITESIDFYGDMTLNGFVKNRSAQTLNFVKVTFVALKNGTVVNTHSSAINGSLCDSTGACLFPEGAGSFQVNFEMPPSEIDRFYYKINYTVLDEGDDPLLP